ncbi:MAG: hypothetical protein H7326_06370 [Bdellovibrionaceae bacterium]|nr:hypothetical protein [Pseudobdellovibrionaceae bacterium]
MNSKLRLVIVQDPGSYFLIQGNTIYIGQEMLEARGHLEKALLKKWYRENSQNLFAYEGLFEEVFTDFMVYLVKGSLKLEDPFRGVQTKLNGSRWPQVLKSAQAYCQSPWKRSEHYKFCQDAKSRTELKNDQILEYSVRPLLVSSWIQSYKALSFREQYKFVTLLRELIATDHIPDLPLVRTGGVIPDTDPLTEASEAIKNISYFLTSSYLTQYSDAHRVFITLVANNLSRSGYSQSFGGAFFDVLYITDGKMSSDSDQFKQFLTLSRKNPKIKIAIKDKENLWMLPSIYPVQWSSLDSLRADRTIYNKCGHYDFKFVWSFANVTDKLMIVNGCGNKNIDLTEYLKDGPEGFGAQNKNIGFIQFHIPSLLMRKDQLSQVNNVTDLVSRREIDNPVFQSLGWREIKYSEKAGAYQPKSVVDGIEWFKVQ